MRNYTRVSTIKEDYARVMLWNVISRFATAVITNIPGGAGYLKFHLCILISLGIFIPVLCGGDCPRQAQAVRVEAFACFSNFSTQTRNLEKTNKQLFSGIDVELLRQFCSSYLQATYCIGSLAAACPPVRRAEIELVLTNMKGVGEELNDLCRTDRLYEVYAQYMRCFMERGSKSDWCFNNSINTTALPTYTHNQLCSRVETTTRCIESNIRHGCGPEAADLVHLLVKPTVRDSGSCRDTVLIQPTADDRTASGRQSTHTAGNKTKSTNGADSIHRLEPSVAAILVPLHLSLISYLLKKTYPS